MHSNDNAICLNMLEAINKIFEISKKYKTEEEFSKDYISFDATMMNFIVVGEMANKLSESFKEKHNTIEWRKISDLRNIIAHDYFGIDDKLRIDLYLGASHVAHVKHFYRFPV